MSWPTRAVVALVTGYRVLLSPVLGRHCRFAPTCSEYARLVLIAHGVGRGGWLAVRRLLRCHPFHPGGYDPPPLPRARSA